MPNSARRTSKRTSSWPRWLTNNPSADMRWSLDVIERQMRQMTRLIDDLLDIARITGNKLTLRPEQIQLADVLRVAVETSRPGIEASGLHFTLSMPPQPIAL